MQGLLDLASVEWFSPAMTPSPLENTLTYDMMRHSVTKRDRIIKIHCDLSRICEVEDTVTEWYD